MAISHTVHLTVAPDEAYVAPCGQRDIALTVHNAGSSVARYRLDVSGLPADWFALDQPRVAPGCRCIELPAGLVGDLDPGATVESTAVRELEEETGFTAERVERLGEFYASPGMLSESFTLVRAHGVRRIGDGGGDESEDINVHLVAREDIPNFVEQKRAEGFGVDVKLMIFMNF